MIYYLDASALVKAYAREEGTERVVDILNQDQFDLYSSQVVYAEVLLSLKRKRDTGEINEESFKALANRFDEDFLQILNVVSIEKKVLEFIRSIAFRHPLKALDAIHLSSALLIREEVDPDSRFVCSDTQLLNYATQEGLLILDPTEPPA